MADRVYVAGDITHAYGVDTPVCDIAVSPSSVNAEVGSAVQFTASGASASGGVTWSVQSGGGSIDSTGLYTAPSTNGSVTIRATSVSDPTCHADATITVLHACENFPPQMWLFTANREISRWQSECRRDLQLGTNEETGTPIPNWLYSTGWQELDKPGRIAGIGTDPSDSITVTVAKTVNGTSPNQGRSFVAEPALGQDDVWNETPAADMKAYKWRLQFEGANTATLRAAGYALEGVSGVGG